jgi:hypothetical protein
VRGDGHERRRLHDPVRRPETAEPRAGRIHADDLEPGRRAHVISIASPKL